MTDRDLIAEGCVHDSELRHIANNPYTAFDRVHKQLAAELLTARAGLADKSARITALKAAIAGLEAAQRPPLGYVVGTRTADGIALAKPYTWVEEMLAGAEQDLANAIEEDGPDAGYQLLEVREVQP